MCFRSLYEIQISPLILGMFGRGTVIISFRSLYEILRELKELYDEKKRVEQFPFSLWDSVTFRYT